MKTELQMWAIGVLLRWIVSLCPDTRLGLFILMRIQDIAAAELAEDKGLAQKGIYK